MSLKFSAMEAHNLANNVIAVFLLVLLQFSGFTSVAAQNAASKSPKWQTLDGSSPLVVARGGFSGLFPDSSSYAYNMAVMTSVSDLVLWCDVQLTKDGSGICFPTLMLNNGSNVDMAYPKKVNSYIVNGVKKSGYFPIDFTLKELQSVYLTQGLFSRPPNFDGSLFQIQTVEDVFTQNKPAGFWLNVEHDAFYSQHKLSMRSYVISAAKTVIISHISSPEIAFLRQMARPFRATKTKLIFRFLDQEATEVSTNQTYGSLLKNLTFIKSFASGILVPKTYIWPVDATTYLLPHTSLVADAHKNGLEVYASDFANDNVIAYNYSYNAVTEYLNFIDNNEFSVDGMLTDFPLTSSAARDCFAHIGSSATAEKKPLVISHFGASGDYPGCTDISYTKAISDGADVIDCPVQMSKDGTPFCLSSVNLMNSTSVIQTPFRNLLSTVSEIQPNQGIFSFSLSWEDIQSLTPVIYSPFTESFLVRNPKFKNAGKLISLEDFLNLAKNASSLSGVLIKIENAKYLAANQSLSVTDAVLGALEKAGYNGTTAKKVMIQSSNSAVLKALKGKKYELVYEVDEAIRDAPNDTIADIKTFADSVVVNKESVYPTNTGFLLGLTDVVPHIQSFKMPVYVQILRNEFVDIAYDFFSDPTVEITSYVLAAGVDGVITDFPKTATDYRKNLCLKMKTTPMYMSPVQPAQLINLVAPDQMPPAEAPNPLLNDADISESPLPAVAAKNDSSAPTSIAEAPKSSAGQQIQIASSTLLSVLPIILAGCLML
ncbi:glycerophosphodiester phosphodiesterase GDPDL3-like [Silene latifolia]|uniref:glycerophosphodiester phosphodiesterase GDPDL3-like n=1 Tax=Silene latifolia TaxID=37657 RepID=UPI003D76F1E1